jgi:hypothetical protein
MHRGLVNITRQENKQSIITLLNIYRLKQGKAGESLVLFLLKISV